MTPDEIFRLVVVLLSGAGAAVIIQAFVERKRLKAETEKIGVDAASLLSSTSLSLLQPMRDRILEMDSELSEARTELEEVRKLVRALHSQLDLYHDRYGDIGTNDE